jgi:predicted regulator of Ras-like GTPase activity (Roadblock/LC7/MglB family)
VQLYLIGDRGALAVVANEGANVALINLKAREQVETAKSLLTGALA